MASLKEAMDTVSDTSIRHVVPVSGGKDSAALALYMAQQYPSVPCEYVFCDTGSELPETYDYLDRLEAFIGSRIKRISVLDYIGVRRKPSRTAFDFVLNEMYSGFLPSPSARWCTRQLKIVPFERFVGKDTAFSYIGIRADETRDGYEARKPPVLSDRANILPVYPFRDNGLGISEIRDILESSGIGMPEYYRWRTRSGCFSASISKSGNGKDFGRNIRSYSSVQNHMSVLAGEIGTHG